MNATGKRRLLSLADFLETEVPAKRFDMDLWGEGNEEGTPRCGTVACALGWATAVPSLWRAGVRFAGKYGDFIGGSPYEVAAHVFDMNSAEFSTIFYPNDTHKLKGRKGAKVVAKRIRRLVAAA